MPSDIQNETDGQPTGTDPETLVDALFDFDVVTETDGDVSTTETFEHRRAINNDTYLDMEPEAFRDAVANAFGISQADAAARIDSGDVTPEAVAAYFALRGHIDELDRDPPSATVLAAMAELVTEIEPASPVPQTLRELTEDDYRTFLENTGDAVIVVFKRDCEPCESTKDLLPEIRELVPDVAFAGVDTAEVPDLLREFEVEAAPTSLVFRDGELAESLRGHRPLETYESVFDEIYD